MNTPEPSSELIRELRELEQRPSTVVQGSVKLAEILVHLPDLADAMPPKEAA